MTWSDLKEVLPKSWRPQHICRDPKVPFSYSGIKLQNISASHFSYETQLHLLVWLILLVHWILTYSCSHLSSNQSSSKQGIPGCPLLQLLLGDPKVFPGQIRYMFPLGQLDMTLKGSILVRYSDHLKNSAICHVLCSCPFDRSASCISVILAIFE